MDHAKRVKVEVYCVGLTCWFAFQTAVTDLKSYLAQKKMSASSPFERYSGLTGKQERESIHGSVSDWVDFPYI